MSKLNTIFETLQEKINNGEITLETANSVLEKAKAKYTDDTVGELTEADELSLDEVINGINLLLNEAEELHREQGTASTSSDGPDLPEKTNTGEGVTSSIEANDKTSTKKMEDLADDNEENAKADAQGEDGKDTTINADDVTESVNILRLRVYEAADAGIITAEEKEAFLDYLNLKNYVIEKKDDKEDEEDEKECDDDDKECKKSKKSKKKDDDDEEECDHEDKDGDGECDKCGADMDEVKESVNALRLRVYEAADAGFITAEEKAEFLDYLDLNNYTTESEDDNDFINKVIDAYSNGVITEQQAVDMISQ